jgi:hypothetical protein
VLATPHRARLRKKRARCCINRKSRGQDDDLIILIRAYGFDRLGDILVEIRGREATLRLATSCEHVSSS